ncbi:MAG: arylesterase [Deltaproteobacteria bacterium]|nr:arylesterase [Deltaproteobacteria bacterium]
MKSKLIIIGLFIAAFVAYLLFPSRYDITNQNPTGENIICFGDSLTYGTGATEGMDYPSQLSVMISQSIINAGVPGDTTSTALARVEDDLLCKSPRIVLITLGGNDLKNRIPRDLAFRNLRTIVTRIQENGALVIVGGVDIPFYGRGFGKAYKQLCKETGSVLVPNILKGIMGNAKFMSDPIHPNNDGYTLMAEKFCEAIKPYL